MMSTICNSIIGYIYWNSYVFRTEVWHLSSNMVRPKLQVCLRFLPNIKKDSERKRLKESKRSKNISMKEY